MELPKRKHVRLKEYDYSQSGYYFVTISTENNLPILSSVGQGIAPADVNVMLSPIGEIAKHELFEIEKMVAHVKVDMHVIMPTHIHIILAFSEEKANARPRPTLMEVICAYKSNTTRMCNKSENVAGRKILQTSFYEKVLRGERGYQDACKYIEENPAKWDMTEHKSI